DLAAATLASRSSSAALALLIPVLPAPFAASFAAALACFAATFACFAAAFAFSFAFFAAALAASFAAFSLRAAARFFACSFLRAMAAACCARFAAWRALSTSFCFNTLFLRIFFLALETRAGLGLRLSLAILAS